MEGMNQTRVQQNSLYDSYILIKMFKKKSTLNSPEIWTEIFAFEVKQKQTSV
jgi:hypothetical protein